MASKSNIVNINQFVKRNPVIGAQIKSKNLINNNRNRSDTSKYEK